jgi:hypothetical protein
MFACNYVFEIPNTFLTNCYKKKSDIENWKSVRQILIFEY